MGNVVKFEAQGKEYPLSIVERESERIVSLQQVGEAMGNKQPRRLLQVLKESREIIEEKHCRYIAERQPWDTQARTRTYLTCQGAIRFAMRSQGQRAREFRDWAEDVLYEVMMTGSYGVLTQNASRQDLERLIADAESKGYKKGIKRGMEIKKMLQEFSHDLLAKIVHFRRLGLTQKEAGAALGISREKVQRIERNLKSVGIAFDGVNLNKRDREIRESFLDNLIASAVTQETALCAVENC